MSLQTHEMTLAGRTLRFETGLLAPKANTALTVRYGDTVVLVTVTSADAREGIDFFPLRVDYEEKLYAGGVIKGSRFLKREGRPTDEAIQGARLIDRTIRPLFPKGFYDEVQVVATVLSVDHENDPQLVALIGAMAALEASDIPWNGPGAAVQVGIDESGELILNPTKTALETSAMKLLVSASTDRIFMVEAEANEVPEEQMTEALAFAQEEVKQLITFITEFKGMVGNEKYEYTPKVLGADDRATVEAYVGDAVREVVATDPDDRPRMKEITDDAVSHFEETLPAALVARAVQNLRKSLIRNIVLADGKRVDGRAFDEVRPLTMELDLLPRTHGSALFARGLTQVLNIATLGPITLEQLLESMEGESTKHYMHHYNAAPFSVGEVGFMRGPGRREIGHGALAEKALVPVLPSREDFPYTIRLVSEVLSQNGSSSMASTCASSLVLMAAGVPISAHVAGISVGLVESGEQYQLLTDIQGIEDFTGDMDFKVAGTRTGITAIQLDVKNTGLTPQMVQETITRAHTARLQILDQMDAVIATPRAELSSYAPRIYTMQIDPEKIGAVIGGGGKVIKGMIKETGAEINVEDDGTVTVSSANEESAQQALSMVEAIVKEPEVGEVYTGKVVRILDFGAFVEILPNKDGLVHISQLAHEHVDRVEDVVNVGDEIEVKVMEIDSLGRVNLSKKVLEPRPEGMEDTHDDRPPRSGGDRRGHHNRGRRNGGNRRGRR